MIGPWLCYGVLLFHPDLPHMARYRNMLKKLRPKANTPVAEMEMN